MRENRQRGGEDARVAEPIARVRLQRRRRRDSPRVAAVPRSLPLLHRKRHRKTWWTERSRRPRVHHRIRRGVPPCAAVGWGGGGTLTAGGNLPSSSRAALVRASDVRRWRTGRRRGGDGAVDLGVGGDAAGKRCLRGGR